MKKVIALGASSSSKSINKQLASWASSQLEVESVVLDLNDFEMPIYSMDYEEAHGIPETAKKFKDAFRDADGLIISFAEHNGSYSAAFKNIFDWTSRIEKSVWLDKPMLLLATSPGARGAITVLATAAGSFPHQGAKVAGEFSLHSFYDNFSAQHGIKDPELRSTFEAQLANFRNAL